MRLARVLPVLLVLLPLASPSRAAESEWKLEKDENGVRITSRAVPGWEIREFRGESRLHGRLSSLVAAISDPAAMPDLNEYIAESREVRRESPTVFFVYTITSMPWPLRDRDVVARRSIEQNPVTGVVTIVDEAAADIVPVNERLVRIVRSRQQWTLAPAADLGVDVTVRLLSDPNGPIPSALINSLSVNNPLKTLRRLQAVVQRPEYATARLPFVREPAPAAQASQ